MNINLKFYDFGKLVSESNYADFDAACTSLINYEYCCDNLWLHKTKPGFFVKRTFD